MHVNREKRVNINETVSNRAPCEVAVLTEHNDRADGEGTEMELFKPKMKGVGGDRRAESLRRTERQERKQERPPLCARASASISCPNRNVCEEQLFV